MSHGHGNPLGPSPRWMRRLVVAIVVPLGLLTLAGIWATWPADDVRGDLRDFSTADTRGEVIEIVPCPGPSPGPCRAGRVQLTEGEEAPAEVTALLPFGPQAPEVDVGDKVILSDVPQAPPDQRYSFQDFDRTSLLGALAALFIVGVLVMSSVRGLGALAGLGSSILLLATFTLPALAEGESPLLIAILTASAVMMVTLYLSHGISVQTSVALIGTLLALITTGLLGALVTAAGDFTGVSDDAAQYIAAINADVDLGGLLLAGLVIGALGVLDDVTVTQTAAVWELADADPTATRSSLFLRGMRIGRSHVASTVNTLALAYIGAALPLFLVFATISTPLATAVSNEQVAQEIVRGLAGGVGILTAVPFTTALAAWVAGAIAERRRASSGPVDR